MAEKRLHIYGHEPQAEPPNGKRWWRETWGKAVGSVLGALVLGALYWIGASAVALKASTIEVYAMPPKVRELRTDVDALKARPPMPDAQVRVLALEIAKELGKQKGRP